jgi:hypothetical protein
LFDSCIVEVDAAGLELGADRIIDAVRRAMLNFISKLYDKFKVGNCTLGERALGMLQAFPQLPMTIFSPLSFS